MTAPCRSRPPATRFSVSASEKTDSRQGELGFRYRESRRSNSMQVRIKLIAVPEFAYQISILASAGLTGPAALIADLR